ncbi:hypothetical protein ACH61_01471 [Rathayibacter tanaceti]|uniref:Uncharacterized protein n=1 Tax=Rathayibacter tanaceti TaxID=1671680 RepID=A0A162FYF7_9MICO|nr:hypothetical protein ACH61_01471 [Rathayibacter tanaceti]
MLVGRPLLRGRHHVRPPSRTRLDLGGEADLDQPFDLHGAGVSEEHEAGTALLLPDEGDVAGVRVGRQRFGEERVAVVPECDQAEGGRGRVEHRAIADDDPGPRVEASDEGRVALGALLPCVEADDRLGRDERGEGELELLLVAVVGHGEDRVAPGGQGIPGQLGESDRPAAHPGTGGEPRRRRDCPDRQPTALREPGEGVRRVSRYSSRFDGG